LRRTRYVPFLIPLLVLFGSGSPAWTQDPPQTIQVPVLGHEAGSSGIILPLTNAQRWYNSILTQHQIICERVEEMRAKLHENLLDTQEFLDEVSLLFERTDRLYANWKQLENGGTPRLRVKGSVGPHKDGVPTQREDAAVGKSLNYLRLSLINFFLGYCDSNGKQIDDAEKQARLSKLWRARSRLFVNELDS
jgi:hypothetical protein